jgi:plasmid stability protein
MIAPDLIKEAPIQMHSTSISLPDDLKVMLEKRASAAHRSLAGEIRYLVEKALKAEDSIQARELRASIEEARA